MERQVIQVFYLPCYPLSSHKKIANNIIEHLRGQNTRIRDGCQALSQPLGRSLTLLWVLYPMWLGSFSLCSICHANMTYLFSKDFATIVSPSCERQNKLAWATFCRHAKYWLPSKRTHLVLMQKVHSTPITQQAEQSWLHTRREQMTCQSIFPEN
jgi:hypothetical protein